MSVENLDGEVWKDVVIDSETYPYQISNYGRIKSLLRTNREKLMKVRKDKDSYLLVNLYREKGSKPRTFKVHRLVATAFLPSIEGKHFVNHKIEGEEGKSINFVFFKSDGSVDEERTTIEWVTHKENMCYGTAIERRKETQKNSTAWKEGVERMKETMNKTQSKKVYQYTKDLELVNTYVSIKEASRRTGFACSNISGCCLGKQNKTVGGYIFSYSPLPNTSNQLTLFPLTEKKIS